MTQFPSLRRKVKDTDPGRATREAADAPAPKPPTEETVAKARSYWGKDEAPVIANPLSRAPYSEVRARAAAARPNTPPRAEVEEPVAVEPKHDPTEEEIAAANERFESYRDGTARRRRQELGLG